MMQKDASASPRQAGRTSSSSLSAITAPLNRSSANSRAWLGVRCVGTGQLPYAHG
jgi:hypothetical protein